MAFGIRCMKQGVFSHWYAIKGNVQRFEFRHIAENIAREANELFASLDGDDRHDRVEVDTLPEGEV